MQNIHAVYIDKYDIRASKACYGNRYDCRYTVPSLNLHDTRDKSIFEIYSS